MRRVTRRSVASKKESSPSESSESTGHKKRGAKKEDPPAEDVAIGEPQATSSKRGGRRVAKEEPKAEVSAKGKAAARGRSSRGGREKKEEEPESDEDVAAESESEEEENLKGSAQNKGKGRTGRGGKSSASRTGESSKAAKEVEKNAEVEENDEKEEESDEDAHTASKSRGGRARGRTSTVTPTPQGGRRGRDKAAAVEENEDKMEADKGEDEEDVESESETTPKGRQRHAVNKEAKGATPSSAGGRRARSQKTEPTQNTPPISGRSSKRAGGASTSPEPEKQGEKPMTEPMDTEEETTFSKTDTEKGELSTSEGMVTEESTEPRLGKKRKLEDEDEHKVKRLRTSMNESDDELDDFIIISKDDVPEPDSKEVTDSLPPLAAEITSQPTTPEDTRFDGPRISLVGTAGFPFVVPLTEAELTKQYTAQQGQQDRDETSSILVEVGSECASDFTGLSSRGLDISDGLSLDSMDPMSVEGIPDLIKDPLPSSDPQAVSAQGGVSSQLCTFPSVDQRALLQKSSSGAASENSQAGIVDSKLPTSPALDKNQGARQSEQCCGTLEVHDGSPHCENACSETASHPSQAPSQNSPVEESAGPHLKPRPENTVPETYVPSSTAIDNRKFILNPSFAAEMMDPAVCFSVVSYNILADCHMSRWDYSYTEPQHLDQDYRHTLLLKEIDYLDGDIVCMQEVNPDYYKQTLLPAMKSRGYDGHFVKRTKDYWDEGEATFVRTSKFDVVSQQSFSLGDLAFREIYSGLPEEVRQAAKKYLDRADVILLTVLKHKKTGKSVTVCNIHVVYDLKAPDVQCIQVACAIMQLVAKAGSDINPHIICGDFNSEVTNPAYQLAKDGYLSDDHIRRLQALENLENTDGSSRSLINHMWNAFQHTSSNLKSAYELTLGKEPPVTSLTNVTNATLDYIFHSAASIDTIGVLETLDKPVVDATGGLPSVSIPSDHLSLKAVFRLK